MKTKLSRASLAEELPYWEFFDSPIPHIVLLDGSLVAGMRVRLKDVECSNEAEVNDVTTSLRTLINSFSEGTTVQFVVNVKSNYSHTIKDHELSKSTELQPLLKTASEIQTQELKTAMKSGELYKPELSIYVRVPMRAAKKAQFFNRPEAFSKNVEDAYEETLNSLWHEIEFLSSSLNSMDLQNDQLTREQMIQHTYYFLNPKRSKTEPPPIVQVNRTDHSDALECVSIQSPREQVTFGDLSLDYHQFTLDSYYHRVLTLKTLPEITFAGQLSSFLRMPFHYDLVLSVDIPEQSKEIAKLQHRRKIAHSLATTQMGNASDLESESKLNSTEELIREILNTGQRIYSAQLNVILRAPANPNAERMLKRQVREVLSRFRTLHGAEALEETVGSWKIVKGILPGAPLALERARKMKTNNLADLLPIYGPHEGDPIPTVIFRNRLNGLVSFDPFEQSLPNYNSLITGSSGAGKSFLNNYMLLQEAARGTRIFIIDIGGSYKKLTEALGGQYVELSLMNNHQLNPFKLPDCSSEPTNRKVKSLLACIGTMIEDNEIFKLSKLDRTLLEREIIELYNLAKVTGKVPVLSDLVGSLSKSPESSLQLIAKLLYTWTGYRPYGQLLDCEEGLNTSAPICTFDLKGLSNHPDLQSVVILILTDFILSQVENDASCKKRIILDEAWELLKSPSAASFMEYCARTLRKTGSGITFITQGLEEIATSPVGPAIINNTATKFIMLQNGNPRLMRSTLNLNSREVEMINSLEQRKGEFSEALLLRSHHRQVLRVFPNPIEYWLSSSDIADNRHLETLSLQGNTLTEAIQKAASEFPSGISRAKKEAV